MEGTLLTGVFTVIKGLDSLSWKEWADDELPSAGESWLALTESERQVVLRVAISEWTASTHQPVGLEEICVLSAAESGAVSLLLREDDLRIEARCDLLLDLEEYLKGTVDESINIWLEPNQDRNALRKLRGVSVGK